MAYKKYSIPGIQLRCPAAAEEWDDWTPGDMVFLAFFYNLIYTQRRPFTNDLTYCISEKDVEIMMNRPAYASNDEEFFSRLRRIFRIGHYNGFYTVTFKPHTFTKRKDNGDHIKMQCCFLILRHLKCQGIWYYLMGRFDSPDFFLDDDMTMTELGDTYQVNRLHRADARHLKFRDDFYPKEKRGTRNAN